MVSLDTNFKNAAICPKSHQLGGSLNYNASNFYNIEKFVNVTDSYQNITDIEIDLPANNWNLTQIDLELNNISVKEETDVIEDLGNEFRGLENNNVEALAMQLTLSQFSIINSVDIYGFKAEASSNPGIINFSIMGWDAGSSEPVGSVEGTTELNMSGDPGWYTQSFSEPIELAAGDYALVMDGADIKSDDYYFWRLNNSKPGSDLYMTKYNYVLFGGGWDWREEYEKVFLHRINKKVDQPFFPSSVNMTIEINGIYYPVTDGSFIGEGELRISSINLKLESSSFEIPVYCNESRYFNFNLNSTINLYNLYIIDTTVEIGNNQTNFWNLTPELENYSYDCYYELKIPNSWENIQVFKDGLNVSSDMNIIQQNNSLKIFSDLITDEAEWLITAENLPKNPAINHSKVIFQLAQDLELEIQPPSIGGKLVFVIQDAENITIYEDIKLVTSDIELFSYLIRSDAEEGYWNVYIYWFNSTDAGFNILTFYVETPKITQPIDPMIIIMLFSLVALVSGGSYGSYRIYRYQMKKKEQKKQVLINKCMDLMNLDFIIVTDKVSSLDLFNQSFVKKDGFDLSLVSGFLSAIRSFGIELTGSSDQSQIIKLEYQDSKIIMSEYKLFRIILIMKDAPSSELLEALKSLTIEIEERFGRFLTDFKGDVRPFKYIERLFMQRLDTSFIYPLRVVESGKIKLTTGEKDIVRKVRKIMKHSKSNYFTVSQIIDKKACNPTDVQNIFSLIKKMIFEPKIRN